MYKMELNEEMTADDVIQNFRVLTESKIESYVEIDGIKIYWNDEERDAKIREAMPKNKVQDHLGNNENQNIDSKKIYSKSPEEKEKEKAFNKYCNLNILSQDIFFTFELGTVLKFTKPEDREDMMDYYIYIYEERNDDTVLKHLNYLAELALILNSNASETEKSLMIQAILNRIGNDSNERQKLKLAFEKAKKYLLNGEEISKLFYLGILDEKVIEAAEEGNKIFGKKMFPFE